MNKKIIDLAVKNEALSVYSYAIHQEEKIPVIITESVGNTFLEQMKSLKIQDSICITMEDLMQGRDVFGVILIHIIARSSCEYCDDTLADIQFEHHQVRTSLEAHLRHFLIDLREYIFAGKDLEGMYRKLMILLDRVRCGLAWYLNGKQILSREEVDEFVEDLDHDWHLELAGLRTLLQQKDMTVSLIALHHALLGLLHKIDTMEENGIK